MTKSSENITNKVDEQHKTKWMLWYASLIVFLILQIVFFAIITSTFKA